MGRKRIQRGFDPVYPAVPVSFSSRPTGTRPRLAGATVKRVDDDGVRSNHLATGTSVLKPPRRQQYKCP